MNSPLRKMLSRVEGVGLFTVAASLGHVVLSE